MRSNKLSPREKEIAQLAIEGFTNREIAEKLNLSPRGVGSRLNYIYIKLGFSGAPRPRQLLKNTPFTFFNFRLEK